MTALHRAYLDTGASEAREHLSVRSLRHGVSTALVALHAAGRGHWRSLNVDRLLATGFSGVCSPGSTTPSSPPCSRRTRDHPRLPRDRGRGHRRHGIKRGRDERPARSSPFMEEIVLHDQGTFDVAAEVDVRTAPRTRG